MNEKRSQEAVYSIPKNYNELDEIAASAPAAKHGRDNVDCPEHHSTQQGPRIPTEASERPQTEQEHAESHYAIPEGYEQLDEVAAPEPVAEGRRPEEDVLEGRLSRQSAQQENLNGRQLRNEPSAVSTSPDNGDVEKDPEYPTKQRASKLGTQLYTISYLIFFSILGTLSRLGLQALTFYPGAPVQTGVLWANVGGSFVLGFFAEDRKLFPTHGTVSPEDQKRMKREIDAAVNDTAPELRTYVQMAHRREMIKRHLVVKKTIPLYIGITVGYCGSFTSFSSFIRDCFLALANALPVPISHPSSTPVSTILNVHRNGGFSLMALMAVIILTVGLCITSLEAGAHLALAVQNFAPSFSTRFVRRYIDTPMVAMAWLAWLGAILMAVWPPDRPSGPSAHASWLQETWRGDALFALVFAPLGCLLRFYASLHLNGVVKSFPLGTFAANIFGTAMEGTFYDLQHVPLGGRIGCQILQGMMDGFCGCLTTVSTWVAELVGLRKRHAYVYGLGSVGLGLSLMVVIMGSLLWTKGFGTPVCGR